MKPGEEKFYTVRGYELMQGERSRLTSGMEDYVEMVMRLSDDKGYTRLSDLAQALHVQPPSASAMVQKLAECGFLEYRKYGVIELTPRGRELGKYLLYRHRIIEEFLSLIGVSSELLAETEKIEHNVSHETVERIRWLIAFFKQKPQYIRIFRKFCQSLEKTPSPS
jgi:Mn-dependent DtxR family transcriptional regulator